MGSTFIRMIQRYAGELQATGNCLMLEGLSEHVLNQLESTKVIDLIGRENLFLAQARFGGSLKEAMAAAERWMAQGSHPNTRYERGIMNYAGFFRRFFALLIDQIVMSILPFVDSFFLAVALGITAGANSGFVSFLSASAALITCVILIFFQFLYFGYFWSKRTTVGIKLINVKIADKATKYRLASASSVPWHHRLLRQRLDFSPRFYLGRV